MQFSEIKGLDDVKANLIAAVENNHVAHAQLFLGEHGSPNLAIALAYVTFLNCTDKQEDDSCGVCPSCSKIQKHIHPDVHFSFPVSSTKSIAAKNAQSINFLKEWRSFLIDNPYGNAGDWSYLFGGENKQLNISKEESRNIIKSLSLKAFDAAYKIMLIWLPEFMHPAAANSILKILEEPPEKTVFILVSNNAEKLLTTILSRTQIFKIRKFSDAELEQILIAEDGLAPNKARQIAHLVDGDLNKAKKLLTDVEDDNHGILRDWLRYCYVRDFTKMVEGADLFHKKNKESQKGLLQYGLTVMRESLISQYGQESLNRMQGEEISFVEKFSTVLDLDKISKITDQFNQGYAHLERNASAKITFLDLSLNVARILRT